jgi:hypothetical protein
MESNDTRGFMDKKLPRPSNENKKVHVEVESWRWSTSSTRLTWKHWLVITVLLAVAILLACGFLIIAGVVLIVGIVVNLVLFLLKKVA